MNIRDGKKNVPVIYLMKKDPELPFGDFTISTIYNEMAESENHYVTNTLEFSDNMEQFSHAFQIPVCKTDQLVQPKMKITSTKASKKS